MRIIFFGTDDFAAAHLDALIKEGHEIAAVVTAPDKARGRGMKVSGTAVKEFAQGKGIAVSEPVDFENLDILDGLHALKADLYVVIAYGRILPKTVLDIPEYGAINVHASLLPKYRGAAPINWALVNGEKETGVSIIQMNERMDAGDVIGKKKVVIGPNDTAVSLRHKLIDAGKEALMETIARINNGKVVAEKQDENQVTLAPKLAKDLGLIDWNKPAHDIHNLIRGLVPWPSAYTFYNGKQLKILAAQVVSGDSDGRPGEVVHVDKESFTVCAGSGTLKVLIVHLADSRPMDVKDFLLGHPLEIGFLFEKA